jgi:hypothetical protein
VQFVAISSHDEMPARMRLPGKSENTHASLSPISAFHASAIGFPAAGLMFQSRKQTTSSVAQDRQPSSKRAIIRLSLRC